MTEARVSKPYGCKVVALQQALPDCRNRVLACQYVSTSRLQHATFNEGILHGFTARVIPVQVPVAT